MAKKGYQDVETTVWIDKNRRLAIKRTKSPFGKKKVTYRLTIINDILQKEYKLPVMTREDIQKVIDEVDKLERIIIEEDL
ncbi:hypothetical protein CMU21_15800 [Elizabethkingia anophelis]|nr:hypothetical protein [Elizabethkingia anophelis]